MNSMKQKIIICLSSILGLLFSPVAFAIGFDEVRNFEDVFVISGKAVGRDRIEVSWAI